jgi:multiple sugar transport system substrate-binding protein
MQTTYRGKRISRRRLLALGSAGATVALLAACGQPAAQPSGPPPAATTAPAAPAKPADAAKPAAPAAQPAAQATTAPAPQAAPAKVAGNVTLTWITPAEVGPEREFYTGFAQAFEKQNPNIKVEVSYEGWADYQTKLPTVLAGGAIPDVIHLHASLVQDYGLRGAVRDMYEFMNKDKVSKDDFFPFLIQQMSDFKTHSKLWAVPKDSAVYAVYYNKDMFDKAGVPYPKMDWTFEQFRETAKALTMDKNGNYATSPKFDPNNVAQWGMNWGNNATDSPLPSSDLWQMVVWGQAGPWFSDDLKEAHFDDEAHVNFVQNIVDMRCKDRSIPQAGDSMGQGDAWRNQLVAMAIAHHSQTFFYNQEKKTFKFDVVLPPSGPKGQFNAAGCSGYTIPAKAQHPDEAWAFIKFLTSPEQVTPMVKVKRWGASIKASEQFLLPDDGNPAHFKEVLYDPMLGQSTAKTQPIIYPPYFGDMRQAWNTEYGEFYTCGGSSMAEAAKRAQAQTQALLDKAWKA